MNHTEFREKIFALYDGSLQPEECRQAQKHLQECPECRTLYDRWQATAKVLFPKVQVEGSEFFVSRVMDRIRALDSPRPRILPRSTLGLRWLVPALAAAMLLLFMSPARQPVSVETLLLGKATGPVSWMLLNQTPSGEEVLGFAMEG